MRLLLKTLNRCVPEISTWRNRLISDIKEAKGWKKSEKKHALRIVTSIKGFYESDNDDDLFDMAGEFYGWIEFFSDYKRATSMSKKEYNEFIERVCKKLNEISPILKFEYIGCSMGKCIGYGYRWCAMIHYDIDLEGLENTRIFD